jgi:hypothetical protein
MNKISSGIAVRNFLLQKNYQLYLSWYSTVCTCLCMQNGAAVFVLSAVRLGLPRRDAFQQES